MTRTRLTLLAAVGVLLPLVASAGQAPPMPKPGPEHAILKDDAGTWDAIVESFMPGAPPATSKGVETNTLGCGGLCLVTDFRGEMMPGQAFHGHGTTAYDPAKKKYVGSWTDSMSAGLMVSETTWDPATKTAAGTMEGPDMTGNIMKMRSVTEHKNPDTRVFTMYGPGPDGKEAMMMRITYKRRP